MSSRIYHAFHYTYNIYHVMTHDFSSIYQTHRLSLICHHLQTYDLLSVLHHLQTQELLSTSHRLQTHNLSPINHHCIPVIRTYIRLSINLTFHFSYLAFQMCMRLNSLFCLLINHLHPCCFSNNWIQHSRESCISVVFDQLLVQMEKKMMEMWCSRSSFKT